MENAQKVYMEIYVTFVDMFVMYLILELIKFAWEIPQSIKSKFVPIDEYFKNAKCEPFFVYDRKSKKVLLDNLSEHRIRKNVGEYQ